MNVPTLRAIWRWFPGVLVFAGFAASMVGLIFAVAIASRPVPGLPTGRGLDRMATTGGLVMEAGIIAIFLGLAILFGRAIRASTRRANSDPLTPGKGTTP